MSNQEEMVHGEERVHRFLFFFLFIIIPIYFFTFFFFGGGGGAYSLVNNSKHKYLFKLFNNYLI